MQFPFELTRATNSVSDDLSELPQHSEYIACFGKCKSLAELDKFTNLRFLWISGVNEKQAQILPTLESVETLVVHDLRTETLSLLKCFPNLETLMIWGNTKTSKLTELAYLKKLKILGLEHFPKIAKIDEISLLKNLKMLCLTGSVDAALNIDTLEPLAELQDLELLHITNLKVSDESLSFVKKLRSLKELQISNQFPTAEYASLKSKRPDIHCTHFVPYILGSLECSKCGAGQAMVIGKRKPFVCPECHPERLKKYKREFEALVANAT
ncbi:Internalin G [Pseudomonas sp. 8Z]|uniref:hypothetical protein n=1 Tax=Pseudomonas sp. 8Z TaxID=2653166 RepID=UPI0012EEE1E0|nr:hypothetical protein [Pseudomonas sp. 8Z]VXC97729.1 Internalin G [Pseudomonas sp. 8Z]